MKENQSGRKENFEAYFRRDLDAYTKERSVPKGKMRKGYLFSSKDGAFSFANEVPGVFENAKNAEGFIEITKLKPSHRTRVEANCCEECRMIVINY